MKYEDPFAYVGRLGETNAGEYIFPFHLPEYAFNHAETHMTASINQSSAHG